MKNRKSSHLIPQIVLIIVVLLGVLLLLTNDINVFFSILYSPYSFLLMVVVLVEYVVMKGLDRSRVYKLENERLKAKRQKELALRQNLEKKLTDIQSEIGDAKSSECLREQIQEILRSLKEI